LSVHGKLPTVTVYLGLGSNIQARANISMGLDLLKQHFGAIQVSQIWQTEPTHQQGPPFLNGAAIIHTHLPEDALKHQVLRHIETRLGRRRTSNKNAPRPLDLDILIYNNKVIDQELWTLPHIAIPLAELYPNLTCPNHGQLAAIAQKFAARVNWVSVPTLVEPKAN